MLRTGSLALLGPFFLALLLAGCSAPSKGALVLAISTDMQAPKDIDVVSIYVTTNGAPRFNYLGRVLPDGSVSLPSTLAIVEPDSQGAQIRIRVTAFKTQTSGDASARVLRDVLTTVPHQRVALLRLPLSFLDDGSGMGKLPGMYVPRGPGGAPEGDTKFDPTMVASSCNFDQDHETSVDGVCTGAAVDSSTLPTYALPEVYGDGGLQPSGAVTGCFDVDTCFAGATPVKGVGLATCTFGLAGSAAPQNLALVTVSTGSCVAQGQCFVPLENDPTTGWSVAGSTVTMVTGVCNALKNGAQLVETTSGPCGALTASQPICEPAAVDGGGATQGGDATVDSAVDAPIDAGTVDATLTDASPLPSPDTGAPDATVDACASEDAAALASDPNNCGACGHSCSGGACASGVCQGVPLVTTSATSIIALAADGTHLYEADYGPFLFSDAGIYEGVSPGTITAYPVLPDGSTGPATVLASGVNLVLSPILSDGTWVYFATSGGGTVERVRIADGTRQTLASAVDFSQTNTFSGLCVDSTNLYYVAIDKFETPRLFAVPLQGGGPVLLSQPTPPVYPSQTLGTQVGLACDGSHVFYATPSYPYLLRFDVPSPLPTDAGVAPFVMSNSGGTEKWGVAVDSTSVYAMNGGNVVAVPRGETVFAIDDAGFPIPGPTVAAFGTLGIPCDTLLADPTHFSASGHVGIIDSTQVVAVAPTDGGPASILFEFNDGGSNPPYQQTFEDPPIAQDSNWIYFVAPDQKTIMHAAK
jgi:hypothetical protein